MNFSRLLVVIAVATGVTWAQGSAQSALVRNLNNRVLQLHGEVFARPANAAWTQLEATAALQQRSQAMAKLIRENPGEALSLAFSPDLLSHLAQAFPQSAAALEQHGEWEGSVEYLIFDEPAMNDHRSLIRLMQATSALDIHFPHSEPPELKCGDRMRVKGVRLGTEVAAADGIVTGTTSGAICGPTGAQNVAVLLVTFPGVTPPSTVTPQGVHDIFFGTSGRSVDGFWREASYGITSATGQVRGWYTLDASYTCSQYYEMRTAALKAADADFDFRQYSRIFILFPTPTACSWAGLATVGCGSASSPGDGTFTASTAWLVAKYMGGRDQGVQLATHEGGHGLGLSHAASRRFTDETLGPVGTTGTLSEYGDVFSSMGSWNLGHYAAPHKSRLTWLANGVNVQTVETSGEYSLQPTEVGPPGLQALKIRRGTGNNSWLWVEYRKPIGAYDSTLNTQIFSGALIHLEDSITGSKSHLLDFTPTTTSWTDPALAAGKSWTDPYSNVSVTISNATSQFANIAVSYGADPCVRANPTVTLSPSNPNVLPGESVSYSTSIKNNDSLGCADTTFALSTAAPSGWVSSLSTNALSLAPGETGSAILMKTPPAGTSAATYGVDLMASDSTRSNKGTANCTVTTPQPSCVRADPTVTLSPLDPSTLPGASVSYSTSIKNNDSSGCAATTFILSTTAPSGWASSLSTGALSLAPGETGLAVLTKTPPQGTPAATYGVDLIASDSTRSKKGTANCTVTAPAASVSVGLSLGIASTGPRSTVPIIAVVLNGTSGTGGASVQFTVVRPNGSSVTQTVIADSTGKAVWNYAPNQKGEHMAQAVASYNGQIATSTILSIEAK